MILNLDSALRDCTGNENGGLAFRRGHEVRLAAVLGPALFLWGAAAGHVVDMVRSHNFAPGNAGVIFWTDILLPIFGFALLALASHSRR